MNESFVLASNNAKKLAELQALLGPHFTLIRQSDLGISAAIEDGLTFVENALKKARHASQLAGMAAIADDSGLQVDYLDGAPGIYSARYAGEGSSDEANNSKLLASLQGVPAQQRQANYYCVIVLVRHSRDPAPMICEGRWQGLILEEPRGRGGFGYDPLFLVPDLGQSAAELVPAQKNAISHRARAMKELLARIGEAST